MVKVLGRGSIVQLEKDVREKKCRQWQLRVCIGQDNTTKKYLTKTRRFKGTKTEAERELRAFIYELENGVRVDTKDMTFEQFSKLWQKEREDSHDFQKGTLRRTDYRIRTLNKHIGNTKLVDISHTTIKNLYVAFRNNGSLCGESLSGTTARGMAVTLKQILNEAVDRDIILKNPCNKISMPTIDTEEKEALSMDEAKRLIGLLSEGSPDAHRMAAHLELMCGLRRGEATGLRWCDFNKRDGFIRITHALSADGKELKRPKTKAGKRTIPLDSQTLARLSEWKEVQAGLLKELGIAQTKNTYVITNCYGGSLHPQNLSRWWGKYRKRNGFEDISLHQLRHTFATLLVANNVDIVTAKTLMGHSDSKMLVELYAHAIDENMIRATEKIGGVLYEARKEEDDPDDSGFIG